MCDSVVLKEITKIILEISFFLSLFSLVLCYRLQRVVKGFQHMVSL